MKTKDREQRFLAFGSSGLRVETRTDEDGKEVRRLEGYAAVFDSDSEDMGFIERIAPGAFVEALRVSDARALFNHNSDHVLGRKSSGTLRLKEDERGLWFDVDLPDTQTARDVVTLIERGDVSGNSFAFTVAEDQWDRESNVRTILRVGELFDVGPVTYPAYPETVVSARALEMAAAIQAHDDEAGAHEIERYELIGRAHELA